MPKVNNLEKSPGKGKHGRDFRILDDGTEFITEGNFYADVLSVREFFAEMPEVCYPICMRSGSSVISAVFFGVFVVAEDIEEEGSDGGGGCSVVSATEGRSGSMSVVFNLFLIISCMLAVCRERRRGLCSGKNTPGNC